ncbi:hypothetical protein GX48_03002 [Paracoccidioides brasiliensis]|nr:hypothetical protein GX48_03002 [Paracoccidioides brasiliensis]
MMYVDAGNDIDFRHNWLRLKRSSPIQAQPEFDGLRNGKYVIKRVQGSPFSHGGPKQHLPELSQLYPSSKGQGDIETRTAECTFGAAVGRHPKKDAECPAQKILLTHKRGYPSGYECMMFLRANRTMRIVNEFASNNYHIEYFAHINRGLVG